MVEVAYLCPLIQVFDMPASLRFYRDLLGFEVVETSGPGDDFDWGWLRLGTANLMLNTAHERGCRPARPDPARIRAHKDTTLFFGADPDAVYAHLRGRGVELEPPKVAPYGMKQVGLSDPDGYGLCFQQPA